MRRSIYLITIGILAVTLTGLAAYRMKKSTGEVYDTSAEAAETEPLPMLYANNRLYRLLSEREEPLGDAASVTGHIESSVEAQEIPGKNGQSNFGGVGNPYSLDETSDELTALVGEHWLRFTAADFQAEPVDLQKLSGDARELIGTDGVELLYADQDTAVFRCAAGLFVCRHAITGWSIAQTLDLAAMGAGATQGDAYSLVTAGSEEALISPECYSPDQEIPVTCRYLYSENRLELKGRFEAVTDPELKWGNSEEGMAVQEMLRKEIGEENKALWISNLYPAGKSDTEAYRFIAVEDTGLKSLQYGIYNKTLEHVTMLPVAVSKVSRR